MWRLCEGGRWELFAFLLGTEQPDKNKKCRQKPKGGGDPRRTTLTTHGYNLQEGDGTLINSRRRRQAQRSKADSRTHQSWMKGKEQLWSDDDATSDDVMSKPRGGPAQGFIERGQPGNTCRKEGDLQNISSIES